MGDTRRFQIVSEFIVRNFKPCRVADVAGGAGLLSFYLNQKGFQSTVIDPRKTDLPRELRVKKVHIQRIRNYFDNRMAEEFDLVVGLHPDQATEPICYAAIKKPTLVIPCCDFWNGIEKHGSPSLYHTIIKFFRRHSVNYREVYFKMGGKNLGFLTNPS